MSSGGRLFSKPVPRIYTTDLMLQTSLFTRFKMENSTHEKIVENSVFPCHYGFGGGGGGEGILVKNGKTSIGAGYSFNQMGPSYVLFKLLSYHWPLGKYTSRVIAPCSITGAAKNRSPNKNSAIVTIV